MDNRIKLFIAEDEALIADEIRRALEGLGYAVTGICYDYATASAAIPASDADLFMLDINLGGPQGRDGLALAELLKATNPKPFIFLTAYSDKDIIARATALQPANYLIKPVNPAALFAAIQLAITRAQEPQDAPDSLPGGNPEFFYIKLGTRKEKLYWRDVYGMEAGKNYVRLFINSQPADYPMRGTIAFVLEQLIPEAMRTQFFRLGRSVCLNKMFVTLVNNEFIICGGKQFENTGHISSMQLGL